MALNFTNTGYINFNKEYNKVLKNGAITVSISVSKKQADGTFEQQYINGLIPEKYVQSIKPLLGKLVDMRGVLDFSNVEHGKGYLNATIFDVKPHETKEQPMEDELELPF